LQPDQGQDPQARDRSNGGGPARQAVASQPAQSPGQAGEVPGHPAQNGAQNGAKPAGPSPAGPSERQVLRLPGAVIAWWAWVAVAVFCLIDMAATGLDHTSAEIAVALLLVTGVMYACAFRPKVVTDAAGITVCNPLRDHRVPWGSVTSVDLAESVRVHCALEPGGQRERAIHSWALYAQRRNRLKAEMMGQSPRRLPRTSPVPDSAAAAAAKQPTAQIMATQLDQLAKDAQDRGAPGGPRVVIWNWWAAAGMAVPAVALALVITLTH
jgi:hypothetical protein